MIEKILQKLGFSDKEIAVYLTSLRLGPSSVRKIAEGAEINRGTTYDILKSLIERGLVSYYHQDKKQYFIAEDPSKLKDVLQQQQQKLKQMSAEIEQVIPQLKSMYDDAGEKPVAKFFEGKNGVKVILNDVLASCLETNSKEYFVYSSSAIKQYLYDVYPNFSRDRIAAGINVKVVSIGPGGEERGLDQRKWLSEKESAPTYLILYAGKMAMISVDGSGKPIGVIVRDRNIFQTQKIVFDFIWNNLK